MTACTLWFFLYSVFEFADAHSILREVAWNRRESKSRPCGNGQPPATADIPNKEINSQVSGRWDVTAGDGNGPVTAKYISADPTKLTSITDATDTIPLTMNTPTSGTGQYPFTFTVPPKMAEVCKGGTDGRSCYIQFSSTSRWYSCTMMSIGSAAPRPTPSPIATTTPAPTADYCFIAPSNLDFCTNIRNKRVFVLGEGNGNGRNEAVNAAITQIREYVEFNSRNTLVLRNGVSDECKTELTDYACSFLFGSCEGKTNADFQSENFVNGQQTCKKRCQRAVSVCDVDPFHATLFNCEDHQNTGPSDSVGTCPDVPVRKIQLKNRYVGKDPIFWDPEGEYLEKIIYVGDTLTFRYNSVTSDVVLVPTLQAFDQCDVSSVETPSGVPTEAGVVEWSWKAPMSETSYYYFVSSKTCDPNASKKQKFKVQVVQTPVGANVIPVNTVPEEVSEAPTSAPRNVPTNEYFSPNLDPLDSSSETLRPKLLFVMVLAFIFT